MVLPYVSADNARNLAEQLRVMVEESTYAADGNDLNVTISIGIATMTPDEENAPRDLIGWADQVLYEAKASGRNKVCQHSK